LVDYLANGEFEEGMLTIMVDLKVEYRDTVLEIE